MNKNNHFTIMFIPEENGKTLTFRIPKYLVLSLIIFVIVLLSGLLLLIFKSGEIAAKLQLLSLIRTENDNLAKENDELRNISDKINSFNQFSEYLYKLAIPEDLKEVYNSNISLEDTIINEGDQVEVNKSITSAPMMPSLNKENLSSIPNIVPVDGWITKHYVSDSLNGHLGHLGLDFAAASGTPIKATASGVVASVDNDKYFGLIVTVYHEGGFVSRYGHCSQLLVAKHDRVKKGQTIALVGNTGRSSAPHLHYEVLKDGKNIDPSQYIFNHKD